MSDRIAAGMSRLNSRLSSKAAATMTYRRASHSVVLSVTKAAAKVSPLTVLSAAISDRDLTQPSPKHADHPFYFNAADLILNSVLTEPDETTDTIEETVGGITTVYRLTKTHDGLPAWAYVDGQESRIRVNGRIKSEA